MNRRTFLRRLTFGTVVAPVATEAQQAAERYRVAFVGIAPRTVAEVAGGPPYKAFVTELQRLGCVEGHNVVIERSFSRKRDGMGGTAVSCARRPSARR